MLKILEDSKNYTAKVFRIKEYTKHPNADRLFIVNVDFNNVITGVEPKIGDMYVYFPVLSVLDKNFIKHINGYSDPSLNENTEVKGFFGKVPRVRPIKLRGEKSEGYMHPASTLEGLYGVTLNEGDEFNTINDVEVCKKYIVEGFKNSISSNIPKKKQESRLLDGMFHLHGSTENFRKNYFKIQPSDLIEISYKKHGTSLVVANIPVKRSLSWVEKIVKKFGVNVKETEYDFIYSSRKIVKNASINKDNQHYYNVDIWGLAKERIKNAIPKGYSLYCEIVGQTPDGSWIQKDYDYGTKSGEFDVWVYKITYTNEDGYTINLSTPQIKEFCNKYNLKFSDTLLYYGYASDLFPHLKVEQHWQEDFLKELEKEYAYDGKCNMCKNDVPREGVVIVKQNMFEYEAYKLKTFEFLGMEDKQAEKEVVNIEDNQ